MGSITLLVSFCMCTPSLILLQIGFGAVYEMQGPTNGFWLWPDSDGIIAKSPVLKPWDGYPPVLQQAKQLREVATIINGVFRVSHHASAALAERIYQAPLLAPYFHFAFGFGWASSLLLTGPVDSTTHPSLKRLLLAGLLCVALFLPPIWITRGLSEAVGLPLARGVPISLAVSVLPLLIFGRVAIPSAGAASATSTSGPDLLLFAISLVMHVFMVSLPWRTPRSTPPGLTALVVFIATMHLAAQYFCCFVAGPRRRDQPKKMA